MTKAKVIRLRIIGRNPCGRSGHFVIEDAHMPGQYKWLIIPPLSSAYFDKNKNPLIPDVDKLLAIDRSDQLSFIQLMDTNQWFTCEELLGEFDKKANDAIEELKASPRFTIWGSVVQRKT